MQARSVERARRVVGMLGKGEVRVRVRVAIRLRGMRLRRDGSAYGQEKLRVAGNLLLVFVAVRNH